jgi:hypothetical protein
MSAVIEDLRSRLAALQTRFAEVGTCAARTAVDVARGGAPASEELLAQLTATSVDFKALRDHVLEVVDRLEVILPQSTETLFSLRDLAPIVDALATTVANSHRLRRHEAARTAALHVIDRVQAIHHRDDSAFAPLADCQAMARAVHQEIARSIGTESDVLDWAERLRPFADLLEILEVEVTADDEHFTKLAESVAAAFGRELSVAAMRGRLSFR